MGMRSAINEMCKWCIYDPHAGGTWIQQVFECKTASCPLHPYRPTGKYGRRARNETNRQIAARNDNTAKGRDADGRWLPKEGGEGDG